MGIIHKIFFATNTTSRDIKDAFGPMLLNQGYKMDVFFNNSEKHIKYVKDTVEFDFWWEGGHRPVLFLKKNGVYLKTDVYQKLVEKYAPVNATIGQISFFINSKLDRDKYYEEHLIFVSNYLKSL